jgi:hypothetical protein
MFSEAFTCLFTKWPTRHSRMFSMCFYANSVLPLRAGMVYWPIYSNLVVQYVFSYFFLLTSLFYCYHVLLLLFNLPQFLLLLFWNFALVSQGSLPLLFSFKLHLFVIKTMEITVVCLFLFLTYSWLFLPYLLMHSNYWFCSKLILEQVSHVIYNI